jgi:anthranilate synthase component I
VSLRASKPARDDIRPDFETFRAAYDAGAAQVVWTRLIADLETPVSAYLKLSDPSKMSFLLESVEGGATRGRYSAIGLAPDIVWRAEGDCAEMNTAPLQDASAFKKQSQPTLTSLRQLLDQSRVTLPEELPPMSAGVFGYMGYDTVRLIEHLPDANPDELGVPDSIFMRPTIMVVFDGLTDEMSIVTPVRPPETSGDTGSDCDAEDAYQKAVSRLEAVINQLKTAATPEASGRGRGVGADLKPVSNTPASDYKSMVERAKEYIRAGDIFQVVLSQRFSVPFELPAFDLYRALRRLNPSPFLFHLNFGAFALVGSSPEILVRVRDGQVTIRPIAGTIHRGGNEAEDRQLSEKLLADPKERSEHLMLLDLGRNDVGRVAETDSVTVTDQFIVERYSHVMHIVSNVVGQLSNKHDSVDALMAGFPAGTVSGAPKVRAMEIIDELERTKRGPYAGCVGYFTADGEMDTCIVLRTGLIKDGVLHVQAGAGIVYDSVPDSELQECINKAKAILRAADEAVHLAGPPSAPRRNKDAS